MACINMICKNTSREDSSMVERNTNKVINAVDFKVQVVKYEISRDGYAVYVIKVIGPQDISFHLKDRYSSLRDF